MPFLCNFHWRHFSGGRLFFDNSNTCFGNWKDLSFAYLVATPFVLKFLHGLKLMPMCTKSIIFPQHSKCTRFFVSGPTLVPKLLVGLIVFLLDNLYHFCWLSSEELLLSAKTSFILLKQNLSWLNLPLHEDKAYLGILAVRNSGAVPGRQW